MGFRQGVSVYDRGRDRVAGVRLDRIVGERKRRAGGQRTAKSAGSIWGRSGGEDEAMVRQIGG